MKVVVLAAYASSLIKFRGPLIEEICQRGHEVTCLAPGKDASLGGMDEVDISSSLETFGAKYRQVDVHRTSVNPHKDLKYASSLNRAISDIEPDRIFAYTMKPIIYGGMVARKLGHEHFYPLFSGLGYAFNLERFSLKQRIVGGLVKRMLRVAVRRSPRVIFQNQDDEQLLTELGIVAPGQQTAIASGSGVDLSYYKYQPLTGQRRPLTFLMVARLLLDKGIREYAAAAELVKQKYPDSRFLLIGPSDENNPAVPTADEMANWKAIEYLGSVKDVRPYLNECDVFVLPSYREGTPRSTLEAMAIGRAVITTDAPGCRETVVDGENGFLVPIRDSGAIVDAMEQFLVEPELCRGMGQVSRAMVEEIFDVRKVNQDMLRFLEIG